MISYYLYLTLHGPQCSCQGQARNLAILTKKQDPSIRMYNISQGKFLYKRVNMYTCSLPENIILDNNMILSVQKNTFQILSNGINVLGPIALEKNTQNGENGMYQLLINFS